MIQLLLIHSIIALLSPVLRPAAASHVFADNYINRSVSILIRDRTARIEYSVAMNDVTIRRLIQQWQSHSFSPETSGTTTALSPATGARQTTDRPSKISAAVASDEADVGVSDRPVVTGDSSRNIVDNADPNAPTAEEETFKNDAKLVAEFRQLVAEKIVEGMIVTCQDQSLTLREINPDLPPKHHMSATVQFEFTLPAEKIADLSFVDTNFAQFDGGARYALKVGGNAVLAKSNVAPILVRANRIEFADLSQAAREQACSIRAQILQTRQP